MPMSFNKVNSKYVDLLLCSLIISLTLVSSAQGITLASYAAGNTSPAPDPVNQGWEISTDFLFTTGPFAGQTRPPEEGTLRASNAGPPVSWEIIDVADDGDDADGMKSGAEYYFKNIGDQSAVDWTLSFDAAALTNGAANPNGVGPSAGSLANNVFHYQVPYNNGSLRFKFWRVELAATDNGNGTFDLWALGREVAGGPPNFIRGKHALLLDNVTETMAHDFYHYEMRYDADLGKASLFFDNGTGLAATAAAGFVGDASGVPHDIDAIADNVVAFGTFTDAGEGHLKVQNVLFSVGGVAGDYDHDGNVNAEDYATWRETFGNSVSPVGGDADGNSNGIVDAADYVFWRAASQGSLSPLSHSVPEPGTAMLLFTVLTLATFSNSRKR